MLVLISKPSDRQAPDRQAQGPSQPASAPLAGTGRSRSRSGPRHRHRRDAQWRPLRRVGDFPGPRRQRDRLCYAQPTCAHRDQCTPQSTLPPSRESGLRVPSSESLRSLCSESLPRAQAPRAPHVRTLSGRFQRKSIWPPST
jgi:hypothetical protein